MRYIYYLILIAASLAYPLTHLAAMERPPTETSAVTSGSHGESPAYRALEKLLAQYQEIAAKGGWPTLKASAKKIEPGGFDPKIETIRDILIVTGDYNPSLRDAVTSDSPSLYDRALEEAVKRFQARHGLTDDGVIGKGTQEALATPVEKRIRQIEGTMKRISELKVEGDRFLIVNIPEYMMHVFENGQKVLQMKVIIGDVKHHTPRFDNAISYVSFNPHWGVPQKIAAEELLPKIIEEPNYIADNDYAIYRLGENGREEVDPATVDWTTLNKNNFPYFLRQRPGLGNALGKIKFGLIGSDGIYLHSTSAPKLFAKEVRALSHGCIRVEKPRELMHFIFKVMDGYDPEKLDARYDGDDSKILKVTPLPVHIVYWSAWLDENGVPNFRKDIYGLD